MRLSTHFIKLYLILLFIIILQGCSKVPDQIIKKEEVIISPPKSYLECKELPKIPKFTLDSFQSDVLKYVTDLWDTADDCYSKLKLTKDFIEAKENKLKPKIKE